MKQIVANGKPLKGRKAVKKALTQLNLQEIAEQNPAVMKSFATIIMVLEGLKTEEFETDMAFRGGEYHFVVSKTKTAVGLLDNHGQVIA